jgi:hypothetical protein
LEVVLAISGCYETHGTPLNSASLAQSRTKGRVRVNSLGLLFGKLSLISLYHSLLNLQICSFLCFLAQ